MQAPSADTALEGGQAGGLALTVRTPRGVRTIEGVVGETLLSALRRAAAPIRSVCGGVASCGTCRVAPDGMWRARLAPPGRTEARLLRCLADAGPHDRLACQLILAPDLDGLAVRVSPPQTALGPA